MFSTQASGQVTVQSGAYTIQFPSGSAISDIRHKLSAAVNLGGDSRAFKGGAELPEDYVTQPGDRIVFSRKTGEKG